jgi:hypothetical protein
VPSKLEHVTKADGNAAFALSLTLDNQIRIDWALVALFYAAMHYVEAYLAVSNQHLKSHATRDNVIGRDAYLKRIYVEYQDLKFYGFSSRYEACAFRAHDVTGIAFNAFQIIKLHIGAKL